MKQDTGIVDIHGKQYQTVAYRVGKFRETHGDWSIITTIIDRTDKDVVLKAEILSPDGRVIATGHSEEQRGASQINRTSALENAETSAIGRALAAFGMGGTEFATADEVANAIHQQRTSPLAARPDIITDAQVDTLATLADEVGADLGKFCAFFKVQKLSALPASQYEVAVKMLEKKRK